MAEQYQEGEVLKGSDGKTYVVVGGVPREQVPVPATPGGVYKLPTSAKEQRDIRGAELAEEAAARAEEGAFREEGKDIRDRIKELRSAYRGEPAVTDYEKSLPNYTAALKTKPGEDLTLLYLWAKTVDPNSTVGASDMENINTSDARLPAAVQSALRELRASEGKFTDEARERLRSGLHQIITQKRAAYDFTRERYAADAQAPEYNIDPERVIFKPFGSQYFNDIQSYWQKQYEKNPASVPPEYRPEQPVAGGGPAVTVSPEESIATFGQLTYDAQGNLVGRAYQQAGGTVYDAQGNELGLTGAVTEEQLQQPAPSFLGGIVSDIGEAITGSERATPTTEALPDWTNMPEMQQLFSLPAFQASLGTMFGGGPQEIAQIVQSNFPGTQVFQDEKGNYILQSPSTGQRYAIKPGFQVSDIPRALGTVLAGGGIQGGVRGAMAVGAREAGLQTGIEAIQAGTGGTFNPEDIAMAGVGGGVLQKAGEVLPAAAGRVVGTMRRGAAPAPVMPQGAPELPGGIMRPGGGVTPPPAPMAAAAPSVAPVAPTGAAGEITTAPREAPTSMMGAGGLSSAPTVGAQPLRFDVAPADILERSTTRAKPGPGVLDDASISDRERVLDALGLPPENRRLGAITGNRSQIEDEVMVSKLGEGSERMQQQFDLESRHLGEYALDLVDRTGGTLNLPPVQRGVAIVKPLEDYQNWYNGRIRELYRQADTAAAEAGVPITLQGLDDALKVNSTFGGKAALTTLRKGIRQKLQEMGAIGPKGELLPIDTRTAETIRQYLNDQWSPEVSRVIGMLKGKIDDDVLSALPTDVYADARQMRRNYANIFEEPKGIAQLLDISGPEGVNRRIALDVVSDKLASLAQKDSAQFNAIVRTLENMPTPELQRVGNQAVAEIRAGILESILKKNVDLEDVAQGGDAMWAGSDKSLSAGLIPFKGKLENIFGPDLARRLETLRVGARILRFVDPNPSGTATASQRLVGKTREALIRSGSAMIGGGIGSVAGPTGAMIGGAAGERAGARLVQTAENRARQAAIARSLDPKEKAAQLAKMRKRQQMAGQ